MSEALTLDTPLPVGSAGRHASGWWGLMAMIVTEACLFGYLLFAYFYLEVQSTQAQNRHYIRCVDNEGVSRDRKDRWH